MRRGYLGGSFDPPHLGHLILSMQAVEYFALDQLEWILTPDPPHKPDRNLTPVQIRADLVEAALGENPELALSRIDMNRPPPHYAADTMAIMRSEYPDDCLIYVIGEDSLAELADWHEPFRLLAHLDLIGVMRRPEAAADLEVLEKEIPGLTCKVQFLPALLIEISSSLIRERIKRGKRYRYLVTEPVRRIIEERRLYRE